MKPLTPRQKQVVDYLVSFRDAHGYSPSYEEIASALQLASLATVHKHIAALQAKGYLNRSYNQSRSLEVVPEYAEQSRTGRGAPELELPVLGRIAAGRPVEAVQGDERLTFSDFVGNPDTFVLQVTGESMIEDHICNGDYVLAEKTSQVKNGDIVVALIDGTEATLKRFYREPDGNIRLQPANAAMQPIFVSPTALEIQGRVLAVLRKYRS